MLAHICPQENEKSRDIIIEQRFHRTIIGQQGARIREIRDRFNQVQITFPDSHRKSDVVTLRGPKTDVDKCYKYLQQLLQELVRIRLTDAAFCFTMTQLANYSCRATADND